MDLRHEFKNAWDQINDNKELDVVMNYANDYMKFLDVGKTERTSAREIIRQAKENGFISVQEAMSKGKISAGDKIYAGNKDKGVALFVIGQEELQNGMRIVGGHIDSPRIDLKPNPLYEDGNMALLKLTTMEV
ncbi:aminopeptidase I zinc metalloprotease family protein [[Clostridium] sordellii ATCC 9714]|nr:aminopeptidase I zinc metalloprotease family protein [[Clostridium] sordellii ATCC 9714] [Paeniclostridium sordellii ATCC 9714]